MSYGYYKRYNNAKAQDRFGNNNWGLKQVFI